MNETIARHRALVSFFYECATSTEINPAAVSVLEHVITEIHAQGRDTIEYLPWYVLEITHTVFDALAKDALGDLEIDGLNLSEPIKPMIEEIRHWIIKEINQFCRIIKSAEIRKARDAYRSVWGRAWPESDRYLATLILDAREHEGIAPGSGARSDEVLKTTLDLMRENHQF